MQDSPGNRKPDEGAQPSDTPSASARRRQWQDMLNEQLRALYETYRTDDVPPHLLELAARIEEAQQKRLSGDASSGSTDDASADREDEAAALGKTKHSG